MPLKRFAFYFVSVSACAVTLFPTVMPSEPAPPQPSFAAADFSNFCPGDLYCADQNMRLAALKKTMLHHKHSEPITLVASNN
jgi:hypothetical protein